MVARGGHHGAERLARSVDLTPLERQLGRFDGVLGSAPRITLLNQDLGHLLARVDRVRSKLEHWLQVLERFLGEAVFEKTSVSVRSRPIDSMDRAGSAACAGVSATMCSEGGGAGARGLVIGRELENLLPDFALVVLPPGFGMEARQFPVNREGLRGLPELVKCPRERCHNFEIVRVYLEAELQLRQGAQRVVAAKVERGQLAGRPSFLRSR